MGDYVPSMTEGAELADEPSALVDPALLNPEALSTTTTSLTLATLTSATLATMTAAPVLILTSTLPPDTMSTLIPIPMLIDSATPASGESLDIIAMSQGAPTNLSTPMSENAAVVSMSPTDMVVNSPAIEAMSISGDAMLDTPIPFVPFPVEMGTAVTTTAAISTVAPTASTFGNPLVDNGSQPDQSQLDPGMTPLTPATSSLVYLDITTITAALTDPTPTDPTMIDASIASVPLPGITGYVASFLFPRI
jgi:hypothetical protein